MIGNDLRIIGQGLKIISQGPAGRWRDRGDVGGAEVIIGERGRVTGTVAAERVIVRGTISGVIRGVTVTLQSSSRRVTSITCRSPSSRAPSSTADADGPPTQRSSKSILALGHARTSIAAVAAVAPRMLGARGACWPCAS